MYMNSGLGSDVSFVSLAAPGYMPARWEMPGGDLIPCWVTATGVTSAPNWSERAYESDLMLDA